ncbi:hypothetical protein GO755_26905 [Spirosoma sp. HMF4905]|uniref:PE-PGRS family protein n=1 Tax=Spirosoma arboris TaxID=2682092 RepID=A0A7K1SIZ9_9BACT|nr:hypothetical protein [Spirosoma arboris]MVM33698.1 hypothetical protein [Spirosoma arboris]
MKYLFLLPPVLLVGLLNSCQQSGESTSETSTAATSDPLPRVSYVVDDIASDTTLFAQPKQIGTMTDSDLEESSGVAPSRRNPGFLWTEEDSGNSNQIQLLRPDGSVAARFTIDGATNRDWEDITVGPGPVSGETYVYLAEIGDNKRRYPEKIIYRFPEPTISGQKLPYTGTVTNAEAIRLTLPDGPQNAEAILIDPATKDLYILSKGDRAELYQATYPQSLTQTIMMKRLLVMPFDKVTSAGISPDNREILIRTYGQLFYYSRRTGESVADALKRTPRLIPLANEPQGEAIGWAIDRSGYYTTSENPNATPQTIYWYKRK